MTFGLFLGTILLWLVVLALLARFVIGGVIDCFKKGSKAGLSSWIGCTLGVIIFVIIALCI